MWANESNNKKCIKFNIYVWSVNLESNLVRQQFGFLEGNSFSNAKNIETTIFEPNIHNPIDLLLQTMIFLLRIVGRIDMQFRSPDRPDGRISNSIALISLEIYGSINCTPWWYELSFKSQFYELKLFQLV